MASDMARNHTIFITGGTGYLGRALIPKLIERGHAVTALVRPGSENKVPTGCRLVVGDALNKKTYGRGIPAADTFIHLVGVAHPSPAKARLFRDIDLVSIQEAVQAAKEADITHFIYLSVAQPAPVMKVYQEVRAEGERLLRESGFHATIFRPWYILGPGHWWPVMLAPVYAVLERLPVTRQSARRLGLVTLHQMVTALAGAVEDDAPGVRIVDVAAIRAASR